MSPSEQQLIAYRREKAVQTLKTAKLLYESEDLDACVNRIYYAMFYEVSAVLMSKNLIASKHRGVMALFAEHFVLPGLVDVKFGKFYSKMFAHRSEADYRDHIKFEKKVVIVWLQQAEEFVQKIDQLFGSKIDLKNPLSQDSKLKNVKFYEDPSRPLSEGEPPLK